MHIPILTEHKQVKRTPNLNLGVNKRLQNKGYGWTTITCTQNLPSFTDHTKAQSETFSCKKVQARRSR